jgi:hypothetical protein
VVLGWHWADFTVEEAYIIRARWRATHDEVLVVAVEARQLGAEALHGDTSRPARAPRPGWSPPESNCSVLVGVPYPTTALSEHFRPQ